ncbi:hypothetical protein [Pelomonas sp. Root1237]|uniref:hypothetical protein n=1 Tax=Pelomonas sp. Root1237 TaxID=1736434 RepID=UPI0012FB56CC|nr:hypothetical protein [Pelomonas sp. Root1237]
MPQRAAPFEAIAACHATLSDVASAEIRKWLPDVVPPTVGLGALGAALVSTEREISDESLDRIASCVEGFLLTSDADAAAVATGFLEAISNLSEDYSASVERIVRHLGDQAVAHIRAWDKFTGVNTPGIVAVPANPALQRTASPPADL